MSGKNKIIALVVVGVCIVALYYVFFSQEVIAPVQENTSPVVETPVQTDAAVTSIAVTHSYQKGVHTVRGVLSLPTPCYTLSTEVETASSTPAVATLIFTSGDPGGVCIQVVDERAFEVTFTGPEETELKGVLNGSPITIAKSTD